MSVLIRPEVTEDRDAIRRVNRDAFGGEAEANLVEALRDLGYVELSLVAEHDGRVVGHLLFSEIRVIAGSTTLKALSLAPMAVLPEFQRSGIGTQLVEEGLQRCRESGHQIVLVLGHPEFYPKFGFAAELARPIESPFGGGDAWMGLELRPGALQGVQGRVEFSAPFMALGS